MSLESRRPSFGTLPPTFGCEVQPERDAVRVVPRGELDVVTAPQLEAQMIGVRDAGCRRLILDLRQLEFMDSNGLHLILNWVAESRRDGFVFELVPGPRAVQRVFELAETADSLPFMDP